MDGMGKYKGGGISMPILFLLYCIAGYWATGKTIYADKVIIYSGNELFKRRITCAVFLGWILIPWALIKVLSRR